MTFNKYNNKDNNEKRIENMSLTERIEKLKKEREYFLRQKESKTLSQEQKVLALKKQG